MAQRVTAKDIVAANAFTDCSNHFLQLVIKSRVGLMDVRRKTMIAKHIDDVKQPMLDEQREWLLSEPVTLDKAVWAQNTCAKYLLYCASLKARKTA